MSKKAKYTDEEIKAKLVELIAYQAEEPTVAQARAFIGVGSNSKIGPMLREALREAEVQKKQMAALPESLQQQIMQSIAPIWQYAQDLGLAQVDRIEAEAQERLSAYETENNGLLKQLDEKEAEISDIRNQFLESYDKNHELHETINRLSGENTVLTVKNEDLEDKCEGLVTELAQLKAMNAELQKELINLVKQKI
ncbi:DNA-binding protein [Curvivirga sp.]|uniref:DNA-binding protein n=1 Tax=Curvivirga sp. TaxID=2856848 RepID=UPI003B590AB4